MAWLATSSGVSRFLATYLAGETLSIGLWTNSSPPSDYSPSQSDTTRPSFSGTYADITLTPAASGLNSSPLYAYENFDAVTWLLTMDQSPETIRGYTIFDSSGYSVAQELLSSPATMQYSGDRIDSTPQFRVKQ